jgi:Flp pilus assembly protein TadG
MMRRLFQDRTAAAGAEFALVIPLLLLLLLGIVDVGRWLWTYNRAEKAAEMGARFAVVTSPITSALNTDYVGACSPVLTQGDPIPASCFSKITCTSSACTSGSIDTNAFNAVVTRMQKLLPELAAANVSIEYNSSGLGYAGNPNGPDISPVVTVKIGDSTAGATPLPFTPITALLFETMNMPTFTASLTAEDLRGSQSN